VDEEEKREFDFKLAKKLLWKKWKKPYLFLIKELINFLMVFLSDFNHKGIHNLLDINFLFD
jgi:hypothetical protein